MNEILAVSRALADESRVRAVMALTGGELCLCQIVEILGLSPSTVSKHMSVLQQSGLVRRRKEGRWRYYRIAEPEAGPVAGEALRWLAAALAGDPTIAADAAELAGVRARGREGSTGCYAAS